MKYKHVIWDWNGTLLDDVGECVAVLNDMLGKRGMELATVERYQKAFSFPVINFYLDLGFDFEKEPFDKVADEYIESYSRRWKNRLSTW